MADGGTILLDEIGELPLPLQVKLFRVLSSGEFSPLGSVKVLKTDVRILACTNRDLEAMIGQGEFREELYYRINVVSIRLPSLTARPEDIPLLTEHFVAKFRKRRGKKIGGVAPEVLAVLRRYDFPGNVRELENAIEHAFVMCRGSTILPEHLPTKILDRSRQNEDRPVPPRSERAILIEALERHGGNRAATARELGIHRSTLWRKIREYDLT